MRLASFLIMLFTVVSFADSLLWDTDSVCPSTGYTPPSSRSVLFDQSYSGTMDNAGQGDELYLRAEDFFLTQEGSIESIEWWGIFIGSQSSTFHLRIYDDNDSSPGTLLWELPEVSVVNTDTGDDFSGHNIYHSEVTLDPSDYFQTEDGEIYWFSMYHNGTGFYWGLLTAGGNMALSYDGGEWSSLEWVGFFRLNGTFSLVLQANTWAGIKTGI